MVLLLEHENINIDPKELSHKSSTMKRPGSPLLNSNY
jgi:hypothetical protein